MENKQNSNVLPSILKRTKLRWGNSRWRGCWKGSSPVSSAFWGRDTRKNDIGGVRFFSVENARAFRLCFLACTMIDKWKKRALIARSPVQVGVARKACAAGCSECGIRAQLTCRCEFSPTELGRSWAQAPYVDSRLFLSRSVWSQGSVCGQRWPRLTFDSHWIQNFCEQRLVWCRTGMTAAAAEMRKRKSLWRQCFRPFFFFFLAVCLVSWQCGCKRFLVSEKVCQGTYETRESVNSGRKKKEKKSGQSHTTGFWQWI